MVRSRVKEGGLELYSPDHPECSLVTAIRVPDGVNGDDVRARMRERHGIFVAGGQGELTGRIWRVRPVRRHHGPRPAQRPGRAVRGARPLSRPRVLVAEPLSEAGLEILRAACDVDEASGADRGAARAHRLL